MPTLNKWQHTFDVKELWLKGEKREISASDFAIEISKQIKNAPFYTKYEDELSYFMEKFECDVDDFDDFDDVWDEFYDWCDDFKVWVKLF